MTITTENNIRYCYISSLCVSIDNRLILQDLILKHHTNRYNVQIYGQLTYFNDCVTNKLFNLEHM